jgi:DNA-binding SARP family transcriptional activator
MPSFLKGGRLVKLADDNLSSDFPFTGGNGQWDKAIDLLKLIQNDYQGARRQLEQVSQRLAEREALVERHLQHAYLSSGALQPLCLVEYKVLNPVNQLGRIILGGATSPPAIPISSGINVRCFGRFQVRSDYGEVKHWRSVKAKSVFQYLLIRPREPAVKERIMEALWPECNPQAAANNLKAAVHQLKLTLDGPGDERHNLPHVLYLQGSYTINPETKLWIDVEEFEKHWSAGRQLERNHHLAEAILEYERAEALYQGDYLEEEIYDEWTILRRESLKDIYLVILSKLASQGMLMNDLENCIHYSQKILYHDHCREDVYRWLMYCYARSGQKNRALRWYDICCQVIRTELDTVPDGKTAELYHRIIKDEEPGPLEAIMSYLKN